jgi:signal transduction histidine kinase
VDGMLYELGYLKLGYKIVVLSLVNTANSTLDRVAISQTEEAKRALQLTPVPFKKIIIPLNHSENLLTKVAQTRKYDTSSKMFDVLTPVMTVDESNSLQQNLGITSIIAFPLISQDKVVGVLSFSLGKQTHEVSTEEKQLLTRFADVAALAVQNVSLFQQLKSERSHLQKMNTQLLQLDKVKDEFISLTSHELRTPLTIMKNYTWLLLNKYKNQPGSEETNKYLSIILHSSDRLTALVEDTLTIANIESKKVVLTCKSVDLISLLQDLIEEYSIKAKEKNITIIFEPSFPSQQAQIDKNRIHQVLVNILGNALKFTPENGVITFTATKPTSTSFQLRITDTGPGIPKEHQDKLFTKFGKIDESYANMPNVNGTGLGLYISQQIMKLHGGSIAAESDYGHGATFIVTLPIDG